MREQTGQVAYQSSVSEPEYIRVAEVQRRFGIPKSTTYLLAAHKRIEGAKIQIRPGSRKSLRVFSVASIRRLIESNSSQEAA
jgi:hypothetical protein